MAIRDDFVNLHLHTDGSIMDSPMTVDRMLDTIKEKGQPATVLTDHGSMINIVDFYQGAKKRGIKPLIGMETYITQEGISDHEATKLAKTDSAMAIDSGVYGTSHLILIAKNAIGYKNLCQMSAIAHTEGYYYQPRIDYDILEKHKEGLVVTTACMFGDFSKMVARNDLSRAKAFAHKMTSMFGDDFYIELQNHGFEEQSKYIPLAMQIAKEVGSNIVVTQDCHYAKPEDWKYQDALFCIGKHQDYNDPKRRTACKEMYIKNRVEMERAFAGFGVPKIAFDNTLNVMNKVEDWNLQPKDYLLPSFLGSKQLSDNKLKELARVGWREKIAKLGLTDEQKKVYTERVNWELAVIASSGFSDYFLIVQDFVNNAKEKGVEVGLGRGSAAGCLVSYLVGITDVDPLEYGLLFERFLVPGRPSMPDIDVDVSDRDFVVHYLEEKYGRDKVSPILNRAEITAKSALIKVSSIFGDYQLGQNLSSLIKKVRGETPSFEKMLTDVAELQIQKQQHPKIFELAEGLEHTTIGLAGHASGVVISSVPLADVIPMHRSKDKIYTAYDKRQIEYVKLVKLDILGIDQLNCLKTARELIKKHRDVDIAMRSIDLTDGKVWAKISLGDTMGVFQFESPLMIDILKTVQPNNMLELAAVNAMGRPGALDADGIVLHYANRKFGREPVIYDHPSLESILKETYGLMIYQEQVMTIARELAGFTYTEVDDFRKCFSYKDATIMEKNKQKFIDGCVKNGYPSELAKSIFTNIEKFAGYGFNKSHAVAYAKLAYWTAWLKCYYTQEYLVACLNTQIGKSIEISDVTKFVMDLEAHGYTIKPPDITKSAAHEFVIDKSELDINGHPMIYYALGAVKGVSPDQVGEWMSMRPFKHLDDAILKAIIVGCNSKNLSILAAVGGFKTLAPNTPYLKSSMELRVHDGKKAVTHEKNKFKRRYDKWMEAIDKNNSNFELSLDLGPSIAPVEPNWHNVSIYTYGMDDMTSLMSKPATESKEETIEDEIEHLGYAISGTLVDDYQNQIRRKADMLTSWWVNKVAEGEQSKVAGKILKVERRPDRNGRMMAFVTISDGRSDVRVLVFSSIYSQFQESTWNKSRVIIVDGLKSKDALIAKDITFLHKDSDPNEKTQKDSATPIQFRGLNNPEQLGFSTSNRTKV